MKKKSFLVSALSAFLLVLSACSGAVIDSSSSGSKSDSSASSSQPTTSSGGGGGGGTSSITPSSSDEPTSSSQEESSSSESGSSSSEVVTQYTITYSAGEGTGTMNPVVVDAGSEHTLLPCGFTREGYHFDYWQVGNDATHRDPGYQFIVNGNVTIIAQWEENEPPVSTAFTITMDEAPLANHKVVGVAFKANLDQSDFDVVPVAINGLKFTVDLGENPASKYSALNFVELNEGVTTFDPQRIEEDVYRISNTINSADFKTGNSSWLFGAMISILSEVPIEMSKSGDSYVANNVHVTKDNLIEGCYYYGFKTEIFDYDNLDSASTGKDYFESEEVDNYKPLKALKNGTFNFTITGSSLKVDLVEIDPEYTITFSAGEGSGSMEPVVMQAGTYILPESTFTAPDGKQFEGWQVGNEAELQYPDAEIDIEGNVTITAKYENIPADQYYVVGIIGGEDNWDSTDIELIANPDKAGEYYLADPIALKNGDAIKAMDGTNNYYPDAADKKWEITEDGNYRVYFRPDQAGGEGWYEGYLYVQKQETPSTDVYVVYKNGDTDHPIALTQSGDAFTAKVTAQRGDYFTATKNDEAFALTAVDYAGNNVKVLNDKLTVLTGDAQEVSIWVHDNTTVWLDGYIQNEYFLTIGTNVNVKLVMNDELLKEYEYYATGLKVKAGDSITVVHDQQPFGIVAKSGENNIDALGLTIHNDCDNTAVYLDVVKEGHPIWVSGYHAEPVEVHYYLVGILNGESKWDSTDYELVPNPSKEGEYYLSERITLKDGDGIKVMNGSSEYYPDGSGNELHITEDGKYDIYFLPDHSGGEGWYAGYIYINKYVPTLYTISFLKGDEGATGEMDPVQAEAGEYVLPICAYNAPDGKQFKAWLVGEDQYQPGEKINIEGATEVTAVWQAIPATKFTVTYKANGGTGEDVVVNDISGSYQLADNTAFAKEGYAFKCWSVGGVEKAVGAYIDVEAATEVLAVWEEEYTITFDGNSGTGSMTPVKQVAGQYTLPDNDFTAPDGYQFLGWKIGEVDTIRQPGYKFEIAGNVTIQAQWEELPPVAPEKSVWVGRAGVWSKLADLEDNPGAAGELQALNVTFEEGDEFVIRVVGDNYIKTINAGGAKDNFTFNGESNIIVNEGKAGAYNLYIWGENNTKLSIERVYTNEGIKAYYTSAFNDESHQYVFVGEKVTTNGNLVIKYVRDDLSEVEISAEDYNNVIYYMDEECTEEANIDYVFTAAEHNFDITTYVKLGDFKTSFSFTVIYKNYVHHQSGAEWVDTPLTENMFEHKVALIHLDNADKFAVRTLGTWVSGLEGDYYPNGAYTQEGDLYRNHYSSIWNGSSDVQKVTGIMYDVSWQTTVAGDYVIGVREGDSGVIVYRTNWTVTLKRGSNDPVVLVPTATLTREYQFERVELQEGDIITIQRGDIKYGYNYYNGTKSFYECFNKDGAIGNFAGYDGENSWVVKAGCSGIYSFYLKPEMVYYSQSKQFSVTVSPSIYVVKEDLWYYTKGSAEPVEMNYDPYDSSNSVILPNIDLEEGDTISFNDAVLSNIGYSNISNAEQKALFTEGENNKLVVKESGAYTFHIVRATGAITVDYASKTAQGGFKRGTNYVVGSADFHSGTSSEGESWDDVEKAFVMVLSDEDKPENCEHQYKAVVTFKQDDQWMIRTNIYWPYEIEKYGAFKDNLYMELTLDGNIKVNRAGKYEIYLKTNADGYWSLYVSEPKDFTPDQSNVSMAVGGDVDVFVSYATGAEFETLTAVSNKESIATTDVNIGLKRIRIHGVAAGETFVTISDGKTDVIINVTVYGTYAVTFEMDLTELKGWEHTSNFSLYVFGTDDYAPKTWGECANNIDSGKVIFTIPDGKDITGAVFYFVENEVQKQSKDIAVNITAEGTYIVTFVDHWEEVEEDVLKLDEMTIAPKALKLNKDEVTLEKGELDNSVIASDWMGELSVISDHPEYATAVIDNKGTVTITGVGVGEAVIIVSDGINNRDVTVTVTAPVAKYAVKFEMDLSVVKSWDKTSNFSLYVFGNDKYQPKTWDKCANNIDSGSVTFNILEGKDITGAVFYFEQDGELKQSTDIAVNITEAGTYIVNFVNHWLEVEEDVWKLDEMTITQKVLTVNKNALTIEKEEVDESVVASNWVGPLTATSNQPDVASVTIDAKSGVATITGNGIGDAVITISDGTTNKVVNVTVAAVVEKYTVTYQANGGTGADVVVNDIVGSYQLKDVNPFTAPEGKQFKAWKVGETEYALGAEIAVGADTVVKAVWEDVVYTVDVWSKFSIADASKPVYAWVWTNDKDGKFYECVHVSESWETEYNRHYTMTFSEVPTGKNILVVCFSSVTDDNPDWKNEISRSGDCIIKTGGSHGYQIDTYNDLKS